MPRVAFAIWLASVAEVEALNGVPVAKPQEAIVALLKRVIPSVVAIHVLRGRPTATDAPGQAWKIERAEGSGFVVSSDGFIATNKHVVHGAYDVRVLFSDGRLIEAKVVYESPVIDVAVMKVETDHLPPAVSLARDDALELGERVVAIGNPEGLGISASSGIVSALDRNLKQSPYDRYIQTDAAINPGNSGGPLFNLGGEVVGMNSLSWTQAEGSESGGLGFAIPGSSLSFLIDQLKGKGRIACGSLGVNGQKLTPEMKDALTFPGRNGVIVATVDQGSAAKKAGLRSGDVLSAFDGRELDDITSLNQAACFALGRSVSLQVWRDGRYLPMTAVMTGTEDLAVSSSMLAEPRFASAGDLGMTLSPIDDAARLQYGLKPNIDGVVVRTVSASSAAAIAGLGPGDVITSLQMTPLSTGRTFDETFAMYGRTARRRWVIAMVWTAGGGRWISLPVRLRDAP